MNYIKAEATSLFVGDIEFDAIRVIETGEYRMHQSQILLPIGASTNWFNTLGKPNGVGIDKLKENGFTANVLRVEYTKNNTKTRGLSYPVSDAMAVWRYFAMKGNASAQRYCGLPITAKPAKPRVMKRAITKYSEEWYQLRLHQSIGGVREVVTPAGNIDLLTSTELIEVKCVKNWKAGIGQLLVYGFYYPNHLLRLHLFGLLCIDMSKLIEAHCNRANIRLTCDNLNADV